MSLYHIKSIVYQKRAKSGYYFTCSLQVSSHVQSIFFLTIRQKKKKPGCYNWAQIFLVLKISEIGLLFHPPPIQIYSRNKDFDTITLMSYELGKLNITVKGIKDSKQSYMILLLVFLFGICFFCCFFKCKVLFLGFCVFFLFFTFKLLIFKTDYIYAFSWLLAFYAL